MELLRKYCRICWNSQGWVRPTGEAAELESPGSHVYEYGYGVEEWLFNFDWMIGPYHYSFLQPINRYFEYFSGTTLDIVLYTFSPHDRLFVGEIRSCSVLTIEESKNIADIYNQRGWIDEMVNHLGRVGVEPEDIGWFTQSLHPVHVFNIKFRQNDLSLLNPFRPVPEDHKIRRVGRYQPLNVKPEFSLER